MNASTQRADSPSPIVERDGEPLHEPAFVPEEHSFTAGKWQAATSEREFSSAGARAVLGTALAVLAAIWLAYTAWSAGIALVAQPISSPALAQWIAIGAGPLALLGLVWLMFGRTRRKEAERFTQSVIEMRTEAESLQTVLGILTQRIEESRTELGSVASRLMELGDEATARLDGISRGLDHSSGELKRRGDALDRAAESARNDIAVILEDLPKAEESARSMARELRSAGSEASSKAAEFEQRVSTLAAQAGETERTLESATSRVEEELGRLQSAGADAAQRIEAAETGLKSSVETVLGQTLTALDAIRSGIETQSAAVTALVEQSRSGIGSAGIEAADSLNASVSRANQSLDELSTKVAEQERVSQRITAETARALGEMDQQFHALAEKGDKRATTFVEAVAIARSQLEDFGRDGTAQRESIEQLAERTDALRALMEQLTARVREELSGAVGDAEAGARRMMESTSAARPELEWMREAATEASARIADSTATLAEQQDRFAAFLAQLDEGVSGAGERLSTLTGTIAQAKDEADLLSHETAPALVEAMVRVREAAAQAAERAREAITKVIPDSAEQLSNETREALERVIRESIEDRLREVETTAAKAVEAARAASDRLTQQMISLGQSAAALEQHIEETDAARREKDSEAFARRVALLIDSMHSASIDVGKILSDEVDDKAWDSYLRGNRGVFTRRAVRLVHGTETRAILAHYDSEPEFQQSVNRFVHDFEAMLRRVLAERDGGVIAVTLMSSDMGKLYAALAQAIERRR